MKQLVLPALLFISCCITSCNAFMHGYTADKAQNAYYLLTGNNDNFADRRLRYTKGFYKGSPLATFLGEDNHRGTPAFIFEYKKDKRHGIQLFYPALDSVFIFEQPRKNCTCANLVSARTFTEYERLTYEKLKEAKP